LTCEDNVPFHVKIALLLSEKGKLLSVITGPLQLQTMCHQARAVSVTSVAPIEGMGVRARQHGGGKDKGEGSGPAIFLLRSSRKGAVNVRRCHHVHRRRRTAAAGGSMAFRRQGLSLVRSIAQFILQPASDKYRKASRYIYTVLPFKLSYTTQ
jgi:hypothetical protein